MKMKTLLAIAVVTVPLSAFADTVPFSMQYITPSVTGSGYDLHLMNPGDYSTNLATTVTDQSSILPNISLNSSILTIKDFFKANADVSITKTYQEYSDSTQSNTTKTANSSTIKVRRETTTRFSGKVTTSTSWYAGTIFLPFETPISETYLDSTALPKKYTVTVNWADYALQRNDDINNLANGTYYLSDKGVTFLSSNLTKYPATVRLKIDNAYSNYAVINRVGYQLGMPTMYQYRNNNGNTVYTFTFFAPDHANYLQNFRFNVNGNFVDTGSVSVYGNQFSLDIPVNTLASSSSAIPVFIQDPYGVVSNAIYLRGDDYTGLNITSISLGNGKDASWNFKISGEGGGFRTSYATDYSIVINGTEYSLLGTRVPVMSSNGSTQTDSYGNTVYQTKYTINLQHGGDNGLSFDFYYSQLVEGKNTIAVKNTITGKTSNTITFTKGDYSHIDYGNSTTSGGNDVQAYIWFQQGNTILQKQSDFLYTPIGDITAGTITAKNLSASSLYRVSFKIRSNQKTNPFKDISYNGSSLAPQTDNDGAFYYAYEQVGLGGSFDNGNLVYSPNEYFNVDGGKVSFSLGDFSISKVSMNGTSEISVFTGATAYPMEFAYRYDYGNCFDGGKNYCSLAGLKSPMATYSFTFGEQKVSDISSGPVTPVELVSMTFKNQTNTSRYNQYKAAYVKIKTLGLSDIRVARCGLIINSIIRNLKIMEDAKSDFSVNVAKENVRSGILSLSKLLKK